MSSLLGNRFLKSNVLPWVSSTAESKIKHQQPVVVGVEFGYFPNSASRSMIKKAPNEKTPYSYS
jgi:hypothetical protein